MTDIAIFKRHYHLALLRLTALAEARGRIAGDVDPAARESIDYELRRINTECNWLVGCIYAEQQTTQPEPEAIPARKGYSAFGTMLIQAKRAGAI